MLNLGIEGIMTVGAIAGWFTVYSGGDLWTGVLVAALAGAVFGLLHAVLTVPLGLSQHVVGIGITLLATSLTYFTYRLLLPEVTSPPKIEPFQPLAIPGLSDIPIIGAGAVQPDAADLSRLRHRRASSPGCSTARRSASPSAPPARTRPPPRRRASPSPRIRMGAVMAGSALMAIGGAFLTLSAFNSFFFEMINGRGWICIALVVFGSWRPGKALLGALLFAAFDAYQVRLQQITGGVVPYQIFLMMPYVLSILALILVARRATYPQALMIPYQKGER